MSKFIKFGADSVLNINDIACFEVVIVSAVGGKTEWNLIATHIGHCNRRSISFDTYEEAKKALTVLKTVLDAGHNKGS